MKNFLKYVVVAFFVLVFTISISFEKVLAYVDLGKESAYVYDRQAFDLKIPDAYEYKNSVSLKGIGGLNIISPTDMFIASTNEAYVVDSETGTVICFDKELRFAKAIQSFTKKDGQKTTLKKPEGIFVTADKTYYIADTGNNRVLVADKDLKVLMEITMPKNLIGNSLSSFLPSKVVVDSAGRISVSAKNINSGIMQFSKDGEFTGYTGAPTVSIDAFTRMLRKFSTQAQRAQMQQFVPTEYNNIKIDEQNFIFGTISSISAEDIVKTVKSADLTGKITPIKKLNTMGVDVLRRKGVFPPIGDLYFNNTPSRIIDVGLGPNKIYTMLDANLGRMFTYNNDGILLYAFGNKGNRKGNSQTPIAIDYLGEDILYLDSALCEIVRFEPTSYGGLLIEAENNYQNGDYEEAYDKWAKVAELNSNFEYAYIGLGNAKYNNQDYEAAMEYYKYADDKDNFSKAKEKLRKENSKQAFPVIFSTLLALMLFYIIYVSFNKVRKYARGE